MSKGEVRFIVFSIACKRNYMVDIETFIVKFQVNRFLTNETFSLLLFKKTFYEIVSFFF